MLVFLSVAPGVALIPLFMDIFGRFPVAFKLIVPVALKLLFDMAFIFPYPLGLLLITMFAFFG